MANNDSIGKTLTVALLLCLFCSIVVSMAAVLLRPMQEANQALDLKRNILEAAGLLGEGGSVEEQFEKIAVRVIDLSTGMFTEDIDPDTFDQLGSLKDSSQSSELAKADDLAKISRKENYSLVYLVQNDTQVERIILPVRGYGLWSTLYGFVALEADANTIIGLTFYEHGETPGLGGEIDNPNWKALWTGKKVYDDNGLLQIEVIKGIVNQADAAAIHQVDGLSGATLTSRGVNNLVKFWLSKEGFMPFLLNLKAGDA